MFHDKARTDAASQLTALASAGVSTQADETPEGGVGFQTGTIVGPDRSEFEVSTGLPHLIQPVSMKQLAAEFGVHRNTVATTPAFRSGDWV